jgi:hypothetical protein
MGAEAVQVEKVLVTLEEQLNGLITNDKFGLTRQGKVTLSWRRGPLRLHR